MWPLFKVVNLIFLLVSSMAWFGAWLPFNTIPVLVSAFMIVCFAFGHFNLKVTKNFYLALGVLILYTCYNLLTTDGIYSLLIFMSYLPILLVSMLDKPHMKDLLKFVTKWTCIILGVSLGWYALSKIMPLPHSEFICPWNEWYLPFDNYYFFLEGKMYESEDAGIMRFSSVFLEPGHLSMICSLLLFANKYDFKKNPLLWIPLACIVVSFSLVGYIIVILSIMMLKIRNAVNMIAIATLFGGTYVFATEIWNGGDNPINILIFERLEFDKDKGISGNNRTVKATNIYFRQCVKNGEIWTGVYNQQDGTDKVKGAGYKIFMLKYGIIGTIFVALIYLMLIPKHANKRFAYSFFVIIVLLFMQRAYPSWYSWLFFYTVGIGSTRGEAFFSAARAAQLEKKRKKKEKARKKRLGTHSVPALPLSSNEVGTESPEAIKAHPTSDQSHI